MGSSLEFGQHKKEIYRGVKNTTNNRMEISAVIGGLKTLTRYDLPVEILTDSAYVCNCIQKQWYKKWMNNGWMNASKKPVENRDLWLLLIAEIEKFKFISFTKVKGHSTNEGNNRADQLANMAMDSITND